MKNFFLYYLQMCMKYSDTFLVNIYPERALLHTCTPIPQISPVVYGSHFGKWLPRLTQTKFQVPQYLKMIKTYYSTCVPIFMILLQNEQLFDYAPWLIDKLSWELTSKAQQIAGKEHCSD